LIRSGDPATDATLHALAPAFVAMLEDLTDRQREVARLLLLEGRRRAQIAEALRISRPTVSVMVDRARLEELPGVAAALDAIFAAAVAPAHPIAR
jgi:DNA-binding CsgD family transcriptional regulator